MVKLTMFLVRLLKMPLTWMGADFKQLELILQTRLTIDFRNAPSMGQASAKKKRTFRTQLIIYVFMGMFISFGFITIHDLLLNYTIAYSVIMVMMATTLISEFTSVLFDPRDNQIILVRPVNNRTILLSKLLHIQFYVLYIAIALSVITIIVTFLKYGALSALFFILGVGLSTWITLLITTLFYLLISKVVSNEKFKDIITYVQIILAVIVMGGYQLLPRIIEVDALKNFTMTVHGWTYLIPPAWLAGWVQLSIPEGVTIKIIYLALPAIIFALGGGIVMIRLLSGNFTHILMASAEESSSLKSEYQNRMRKKESIFQFLCVSEYEKTGWKLTNTITHRDRKFKQSVYPSYGFMIIMAFVLLRPDFNNLSDWYYQLQDSSRYLFIIFFGFFASNSINQIYYSDKFEAAWVYRALPVISPGHILTGAIKIMLIKYFIPVYSVLIIIVTLIWGIHLLPLMALGAALIISSTLITMLVMTISLPFTKPYEMQQKGSNFLKMMLGFVIMGVIVGIVYLASFLPIWGIILLSLLVLVGNSFVFKAIRKEKIGYGTDEF